MFYRFKTDFRLNEIFKYKNNTYADVGNFLIMKNAIQHFLKHHMLVNWSNLNKCILVLTLTTLQHLLWIIWKLYIIYHPTIWQWVNLDLIQSQLILNYVSLTIVIILIIPCLLLRKRPWAEAILPYFILTSFSLIFIRDAYLIGILSPATLCGYVCISGLGILLFNRKILYTSVLIATSVFFYLGILTLNGTLTYAPLFSDFLKSNIPPTNLFWVMSMLYFIVPILLSCLLLCEIVLIQWRQREKMIQKLSQTDPLTDLLNRRSFNDKVQLLEKKQLQYSIIILDLDHFKAINDRYGHSIGDDTLILVSQSLIQNIPTEDIVARYGGEEFIICLHHTDQLKALKIAEACRQAIQKIQIKINDQHNIHITASFGIAFSSENVSLEQAIRHADDALYLAKQQGRNQVKFYQNHSIIA